MQHDLEGTSWNTDLLVAYVSSYTHWVMQHGVKETNFTQVESSFLRTTYH